MQMSWSSSWAWAFGRLSLGWGLCWSLFWGLCVAVPVERLVAAPNVIIFYADDLGWGELGCQGNREIPTPHIDSLATNGMRCTQGYVAATYCSPSRAGLLSGRYPTRFGHETNGEHDSSGFLQQTTLATRLKQLGYATACVGKWHLGVSPERRPMARGFDEFYGTLNNTPFYHPKNFIDSRKSPEVVPVDDKDFYTTDAYAERSVDWIKAHAGGPWFLYLPFNAQHAPLQAPQKYLDRFPSITDPKRKLFAAMLSSMDDAVGRVLSTVRELGQEENTLVFFIGDNGGPTQGTTSQNGPLRGFKMTTFEGGPRVPFLVQWKGRIPGGTTYDLPVMNLDVVPTVMAAAGKPIAAEEKLDGVDLLPFLTGAAQGRPHETMFWRFVGQWAVRDGDWKLVVSNGGSGQPELYDLAADVGEKTNLASSQPERVTALKQKYDAWAAEQAPPPDPAKGPGGRPKGKGPNRKRAKAATT
jgi:arylsulfatase A-like enzyme